MIRIVTPDQKSTITRIIALEAEAFGDGGLDEWNLLPLIRHGRVFVLEEDSLTAACIQYMKDWNDPSKAYAVGISVDKNRRGKGYGTELFRASMDILADEGIKTVELTVDPENASAVAVYGRKLGFVISEERRDEYGEGVHRIVMIKDL